MSADDCAATREEVSDEQLVDEVRVDESQCSESASDSDGESDDELVCVQRAMDAITDLKKFVASRGIGAEFVFSLDKLDRTVTQSCFQKLMLSKIVSFFK